MEAAQPNQAHSTPYPDKEKVVSALQYVDPTHDNQFMVVCALKSHTPFRLDEARDIFDEWYQPPDQKRVGEVEALWSKVKAASGVQNLSLASLYGAAHEAGWSFSKERKKAITAEAEMTAQAAADLAQQLLQRCLPAPKDHPYLVRKQVKPSSTLFELPREYLPPGRAKGLKGRLLFVPMTKESGVSSFQLIGSNNGKDGKYFLAGGSVAGAFWMAQPLTPEVLKHPLVFGEGVATVLSICQATGYPGVATMSIGQFGPVLKFFRKELPDQELILCADLEKSGRPNAKAVHAAHNVGARLALPDFGEDWDDFESYTDFNDMAVYLGDEKVKEAVEKARTKTVEEAINEDPGLVDPLVKGRLPAARKHFPNSPEYLTFLREFGVTRLGTKTFVLYRARVRVTEDEDDPDSRARYFYTTILMDKAALTELMKGATYYPGKGKEIDLVDAWTNNSQRRKYLDTVFDPKPNMYAGEFALPAGPTYNLYQGMAIVPKEGSCELIKKHIGVDWCHEQEDLTCYVLDWFASMIQKPGRRGMSCIVLKGDEGTGKSIITDIFRDAFGGHATVVTKPETLLKWNLRIGQSVFVVLNEVVWGGNRSLDGPLKEMITDPMLDVEEKFIPSFSVRNCVHLMMCSNKDWVAPIGRTDRRYLVLDVANTHVNDPSYFLPLVEEIENGGREAFLYELMHRDMTGFNPTEIPVPEGYQETRYESVISTEESEFSWWAECLEHGVILDHKAADTRWMNVAQGWDHKEIRISTTHLYSIYQEWCKRQVPQERASSSGKFSTSVLNRLNTKDVSVNNKNRVNSGQPHEREKCYTFQSLQICREEFEKRIKCAGPWNNDQTVYDGDFEDYESKIIGADTPAPNVVNIR